jgi:hypothetical protein
LLGISTGPVGWGILGASLVLGGASLLSEGVSYWYNWGDTERERWLLATG